MQTGSNAVAVRRSQKPNLEFISVYLLEYFQMIQTLIKKLIFPIKRSEWAVFASMLIIVCLININFSILRSMRNTLVVADTGGSAAFIPYFELFGTFPASILLTWGLSRLMRFFSLRFIFSSTLFFFLTFFVVF